MPGTVLARRYRIVSLVGRGGMGAVYEAEDLRLGEPVAVKLLPRSLADDPGARRRLAEEVRVARRVTHPNVCRVHDLVESEGRVLLTMERIDGEDLASLLRRVGHLPAGRGLEVARQIAAGLAAIHARGLLHRDLKPGNVMIDGQGRARITDFGLAVAGEGPAGELAGTPAYMAPEQLERGGASRASDVYALGLVLWELFTGERPFPARGDRAALAAARRAAPPDPRERVPEMEPQVAELLRRCLDPEPAHRPESARQVLAAFPGVADPLARSLAEGATPSPGEIAAATAPGALGGGLLVVWPLAGLALGAIVLYRGLLAGIAFMAFRPLLAAAPLTLDPDRWYFSNLFVVLALVGGLALAAWWVATGRAEARGEGPARAIAPA